MNLYFECNMGAAGDMIASALIGLFDDSEKTVDELNGLGIPTTKFLLEKKEQCGISGLHLNVIIDGKSETPDDDHHHDHEHHGHEHHNHHHHRKLEDIYEIVDSQNSEHTELKVWDCGFVE